MSDVNLELLARRARLLAGCQAGDLLHELADALEAKAGAEAAGEAVAASDGVGWGVGGVVGAGAAPWPPVTQDVWSRKSVDADKSASPRWSLDGRVWTYEPPVTWTVAGRGAMTPQQMADALAEVDRKLAEERFRFYPKQAELELELKHANGLLSEVSKQADLWRGEADRFRDQAASWKSDCEEVERRLKASRADVAWLRAKLDEKPAGHPQSIAVTLFAELVHELITTNSRPDVKLQLSPDCVARAMRKGGLVVVKPDDVTAAVKTMLWNSNSGWLQWRVEEGAKMVVDALLKTSQS